MSALGPRRAAILLAAGGILIAAGGLTPEAIDLTSRVLHPRIPRAILDRSHWIVFRESLDMLIHPTSELPFMYYVFYAAEVIGLAYPVAAGVLIAASALSRRSRAAAAACLLFHAATLWALLVLALALAASGVAGGDAADPKTAGRYLAGAALLLLLLSIEVAAALRAARRRGRSRMPLVDAVNLPPAAFLLVLNFALFAAFRKHPNWPAAGYAVSALGALIAVAGMVLRRGGSVPLSNVDRRRRPLI